VQYSNQVFRIWFRSIRFAGGLICERAPPRWQFNDSARRTGAAGGARETIPRIFFKGDRWTRSIPDIESVIRTGVQERITLAANYIVANTPSAYIHLYIYVYIYIYIYIYIAYARYMQQTSRLASDYLLTIQQSNRRRGTPAYSKSSLRGIPRAGSNYVNYGVTLG